MTKTPSLYMAVILSAAPAAAAQFGAEAPRAEIPTLSVSLPASAASFAAPLSAPALNLAPQAAPQATASQIQSLGAQLSAAQQKNESPKESLDRTFERSVAEAKGEAAAAAAQADKPAAPSLSPSHQANHPAAPQPPAPKDPRTFWQKQGYAIKGGALGTIVLAASSYILGLKSLEIPAFVGLFTGLLPYLRSMRADGKAGDFLPGYVQSIFGGGIGLLFGWGMSHFGYSTIMAGYSVMTGVFVPQFISGVRKPTSEILPIDQMVGSALAGMVVGGTLPLWLGAKFGRKIGERKNAAK